MTTTTPSTALATIQPDGGRAYACRGDQCDPLVTVVSDR
jgi:hypothetical protein